MKKLLLCTLILALAGFGSRALADDVTLMVTKSSDTMAKVTPEGKDTGSTVPISFASGTSWDDVHDSYTVSSDTAGKLASGSEGIKVNSDGGISYTPITSSKKLKK